MCPKLCKKSSRKRCSDRMIPEPLLDSIRKKQCIPIIGAGFSANATSHNEAIAVPMPTWKELATQLSEDLQVEEQDPLSIFQQFENMHGRHKLINRISELLHQDNVRPSEVHKRFAKISYFDTICTTNYDNLLENSYRNENKATKIIVEQLQISMYGSSPSVKILKMHGDFDHPGNLVITKEDYEQYKNKKPFKHFLYNQLMTKTPLYIGFSLDDPNFLKIKESIDLIMKNTNPKGYIFLFDANDEKIRSYEDKNLHVIPIRANDKTRSECLLKLFDEIDDQSSTEMHTALSVSVNKTVLFKNQTLRIRINMVDKAAQPVILHIKREDGQSIARIDMHSAKVIRSGVFEKEIILEEGKWEEGTSYIIHAKWNEQEAYSSFTVLSTREISVQTDKDVYVYGSCMLLMGIVPYASIGTSINYGIRDEAENIVAEGSIPVRTEDMGIFQTQIHIKGEGWKRRGKKFMASIDYFGKSASVSILLSNSRAAIEFDKEVYSYTDRVHMTIIAPDFTLNPEEINVIGDKQDGLVTIETSLGKITKYRLEEIGINTGIFAGEIILSGFARERSNRTTSRCLPRITKGYGPTDGSLACYLEDRICVSFQISNYETVIKKAKIQEMVPEIMWIGGTYQIGDCAKVRVIDPNRSLSLEELAVFSVHVKSDSDKNGIKIPMCKTRSDTRIFEGCVWLLPRKSSSKFPSLHVSEGNTITTEYSPVNLEYRILSRANIGTDLIPPLERIKVSNPRIVDPFGNKLSRVQRNQTVMIKANLINMQNRSQKLVFAVQIKGDFPEFLGWIDWEIEKHSTDVLTRQWKPEQPGEYTVKIIVWESRNNPVALSPLTKLSISVV